MEDYFALRMARTTLELLRNANRPHLVEAFSQLLQGAVERGNSVHLANYGWMCPVFQVGSDGDKYPEVLVGKTQLTIYLSPQERVAVRSVQDIPEDLLGATSGGV